MAAAIVFTVPGKPYAQGSKRHVGNGRMIESCRELGPWRERVALIAAQSHHGPLLTGAVSADLAFILPRPKSTPKTKTPPAVKKPDIDKLARAVLDSITHTLIVDDSQVVSLFVTKRLAELDETPGVIIAITPKTNGEMR